MTTNYYTDGPAVYRVDMDTLDGAYFDGTDWVPTWHVGHKLLVGDVDPLAPADLRAAMDARSALDGPASHEGHEPT